MKLSILCNFGPYPSHGGSVGGSEAVISEIVEKLSKSPYNCKVDIYAHNYRKFSTYKNINLFPCPKGDNIVPRIAQDGHVMVYSDSQWNFGSMVGAIEKIACKVSICLVGAYYMQSHPEILALLKQNKDRYRIITHSEGPDYKWAVENGLNPQIIPNGVSLSEFNEKKINFRKKYNIKEKYIFLNVSSFFYGKGQEILPDIYDELSQKIKDFVFVQISNSSSLYPYDEPFLSKCKKKAKGKNFIFLRDIDREDVVAAFKSSDIFLMPSKKEVAPLVILESRAAKLPWVSMDVGNVKEQTGGRIIPTFNKDKKGYIIVDDNSIRSFADIILNLLENEEERQSIIEEGQKDINKLDWKNIVPLYNKVFTS